MIVIVNVSFTFLTNLMVQKMSHMDYSKESRTYAIILSIMQFLNSSIIPFFLFLFFGETYNTYDMIYNLQFLFFGNLVSTNFFLYIDVVNLYRKYRQRKIKKNIESSPET